MVHTPLLILFSNSAFYPMKSLRHPPHKKANTHFPIALYHKVSLAFVHFANCTANCGHHDVWVPKTKVYPRTSIFFLSALVAVLQAFLEQIKSSKTAHQRLRESSPQNLRFFPSRVLSFSAWTGFTSTHTKKLFLAAMLLWGMDSMRLPFFW